MIELKFLFQYLMIGEGGEEDEYLSGNYTRR